jgi:SAM-dependent methyltransferase
VKTLIDNYEEVYEAGGQFPQQDNKKEVMFFSNLVSHKKPLRILDIGCAEGELSIELALRNHDVTALDVSRSFLDQVLKKAAYHGVAVRAVHANIEKEVPRIGKFDAIYMMDVIEHFVSPPLALRNIRKMLADDGILIINTPNVANIRKFAGYALKPKKMVSPDADRCGGLHLQEYDYFMLSQLLAFCGFRIRRFVPRSTFSRMFPKLGYNLLAICERAEPMDCGRIMEGWKKKRRKG